MTNNKRKPTTSRGSHTPKPIMYIAHSPYISNIYKFPPIFVPFRFFDFSPYFCHDAFRHDALHLLDTPEVHLPQIQPPPRHSHLWLLPVTNRISTDLKICSSANGPQRPQFVR